MEKIAISTQLLNSILNYLVQRPYQDVYLLINNLQQETTQELDAAQKKKNS